MSWLLVYDPGQMQLVAILERFSLPSLSALPELGVMPLLLAPTYVSFTLLVHPFAL